MKVFQSCRSERAARRSGRLAFTLVEMMTALGVFSLISIALVYTQMFGLRYDELVCSKLGASDKSRMGFDQLTRDIRGAMIWKIGTGSTNSFLPCTNAANQVGNALQISYTADTNSYVRYFFDTTKWWLCRLTNGMTSATIVVPNLTNTTGSSMTFHAEDYRGSNTTDFTYKYVIVTTMELAQYQYPLTKVGPGYYYNYYRMQFKVASHNAAYP